MVMIHDSAYVSDDAQIGKGTRIWHNSHVRENVSIGKGCVLSKNVYVDHGVRVGDNVKIQNNVSIYHKAVIEEGVFIGPHVCFTNDKVPRAVNPDMSPKTGGTEASDWKPKTTTIRTGASIGANATILPGLTIGKWAMVGAGSVVTKDVPDYTLVLGNPARIVGKVDERGNKI